MLEEEKFLNSKLKVKLVEEIEYLSIKELITLYYLGENNQEYQK